VAWYSGHRAYGEGLSAVCDGEEVATGVAMLPGSAIAGSSSSGGNLFAAS
jgi:hypothetical protein